MDDAGCDGKQSHRNYSQFQYESHWYHRCLRTAAQKQLRRRYGIDTRAVPRAVRVCTASQVGTLGARAAPHLTILRGTGTYSRYSNRSWEIFSCRRNKGSSIRVWIPVRQLKATQTIYKR